ncbi:urease accessory protein UreD [Mangrovibrevibacter kandeliae]|uniref:urease accessory protein UreD n=1 Tax=Mangrovibrevibacter kandeliae TaxID=2968473 RepID=UPI0021197F7B|nr:urease accessory protein UreD [Aurantimonas sp. CSK15Z-1]
MTLQRARGTARAVVHAPEGASTRLKRLHQAGCLKLRFPRLPQAEAVLINTSGGLTGGDRIEQHYEVGAAAGLTVTTQACERIYRASAGTAEVATTVAVGEEAELAWLPQETILFDGGRLRRRLELDCAASSRFLVVESVILGRQAMGESLRSGLLHERWRIRRDGRLVFAEDLRLGGDLERLTVAAAGLGGATAFATVLLQAEALEPALEAARRIIGEAGGASRFDGLLVCRLVAESGQALRRRLVPLLHALSTRPLPRLWSF